MRSLPEELLAKERERARAIPVDVGAEPDVDDLWSIKPAISSAQDPSRLIEHSKVPLIVAVLRDAGNILDVAPVSFETDLAGAFDVTVEDAGLLGQPFMVETWLRMPVTRAALHAPIAKLPVGIAHAVAGLARRALTQDAPELSDDDPRRAYRQDERMRVAFAMAGTGEELVLDQPAATPDGDALAIKRRATRWVQAPVRRENGKIPHAYEGYDPVPADSTQMSPTTGGGARR
jgi:hypothetical protein